MQILSIAALVLASTAAALLLPKAWQRLALSRAKHRSLTGHSRVAKRVAGMLPGYAYGEALFFNSDQVDGDTEKRRQVGFARLSAELNERHARTIALTKQAREGISDLQFTAAYRVPFQYSPFLRKHITIGAFMQSSEGVTLTDLDGQRFYDLTGSYGVNVLGNDFYKSCMAEGMALASELGPVLGNYHPVVADNVQRLLAISALDEVSFHMSGTEAVMQAVRLARYHSGRKYLVRFCGAYHGWWDDVQPGPGNPMPPGHTYTLEDMSDRSLAVLAHRKDIACVLVNPVQALHPNAAAPGDGSLIDSSRRAQYHREAYATWLKRLRKVCTQNGIALIFDEVFVGFRLAPGGAQAYFGVQADMVTYGKSLGGGFPVGVVCGRSAWMKRFREDRPADICFARGTFNAHPVVMGAMNAFLKRLETSEIQSIYLNLDATWNARAERLNQRLQRSKLPLRVSNLSSIWTLTYEEPSRYNWMLQFYLRAEGLALSWIGSGRLVFSLNYTETDFEAVCERIECAAQRMVDDGWWSSAPSHSNNRAIRRSVLKEMLSHRLHKH
jgi:glutamate-1-semialdehyde 2,1-aminomutase